MSLTERVKYAEMKARHSKLLLPWYKKWWGILILIFIGLVLIATIASASYVYQEIKRIQNEAETGSLQDQHQQYLDLIAGPGGYFTGTNEPKITIIEFTDFACPFCQKSASGIRDLVEKYKDNVKFVIRDYPVHDTSIDLALAARCAGEQGKYWDAYDSLFLNQNNLIDTETIKTDIISWANSLGILDMTKFETCFTERRYISSIRKDYDDGNELKIQGTPTWFVNNYSITGYYPAEKFQELFDGILQRMEIASTTKTNEK